LKIPSLDSKLLVEELQLGEQLGQCVHNNRRADFSLMLSMLTEDVRAHSQFKLPTTITDTKVLTEESLRKTFELPDKPHLALNDLNEINDYPQAELVEKNLLNTIRLQNTLTPKPLAFRDDKLFISSDVLLNTRLYCQQQHSVKEDKLAEALSFNANEWLKTVQTTIVKAPLLDAVV